ncbi:hypothetical protein ACVWXU_008569 [Streptomyces sp. TE33382]
MTSPVPSLFALWAVAPAATPARRGPRAARGDSGRVRTHPLDPHSQFPRRHLKRTGRAARAEQDRSGTTCRLPDRPGTAKRCDGSSQRTPSSTRPMVTTCAVTPAPRFRGSTTGRGEPPPARCAADGRSRPRPARRVRGDPARGPSGGPSSGGPSSGGPSGSTAGSRSVSRSAGVRAYGARAASGPDRTPRQKSTSDCARSTASSRAPTRSTFERVIAPATGGGCRRRPRPAPPMARRQAAAGDRGGNLLQERPDSRPDELLTVLDQVFCITGHQIRQELQGAPTRAAQQGQRHHQDLRDPGPDPDRRRGRRTADGGRRTADGGRYRNSPLTAWPSIHLRWPRRPAVGIRGQHLEGPVEHMESALLTALAAERRDPAVLARGANQTVLRHLPSRLGGCGHHARPCGGTYDERTERRLSTMEIGDPWLDMAARTRSERRTHL